MALGVAEKGDCGRDGKKTLTGGIDYFDIGCDDKNNRLQSKPF